MTSWHKTGAHPFYIGMYLHIYTHMDVHRFTSQKECLHIFTWQHLLPQVVDGRGKLTLSFLSMELFQTYTNRRMDGTYISCFLSLTSSRRILGCLMFWARRRFSFAVMDSGKFEVRKTHLSLDYAFG